MSITWTKEDQEQLNFLQNKKNRIQDDIRLDFEDIIGKFYYYSMDQYDLITNLQESAELLIPVLQKYIDSKIK